MKKSTVHTIAIVLLALSICFVSCTSKSGKRVHKKPVATRIDSVNAVVNQMAMECTESFSQGYRYTRDSANKWPYSSCLLADETIFQVIDNNPSILTSNPDIYRKYAQILKDAGITYRSSVIDSQDGYKEYGLYYDTMWFPQSLDKWDNKQTASK